MTTDLVSQLHRALDATAVIVRGVTTDQWHLRTPCAGWDVHAVANHLVGGIQAFPDLLAGAVVDDDPTHDHLGADPAAAYDAAARRDHDAWNRLGVMDGTVALAFATVPASMAAVIHLTELVVHGLDLAVATHQHDAIDERLAEQLLDLMRAMGGIDAFRGPGFFGPEVPAQADRPAHERLLAYVGRSVVPVAA